MGVPRRAETPQGTGGQHSLPNCSGPIFQPYLADLFLASSFQAAMLLDPSFLSAFVLRVGLNQFSFFSSAGCKIKALRAKTNTYIKTPVRGEEPVFVVTGKNFFRFMVVVSGPRRVVGTYRRRRAEAPHPVCYFPFLVIHPVARGVGGYRCPLKTTLPMS